jgi:hypothetical protein
MSAQKSGEIPCLVVGTLNLLGDAHNPFEFLPKGGDDSTSLLFMQNYQTLELAATSLTFDRVKTLYDDVALHAASSLNETMPLDSANILRALEEHSDKNQGRVWGFFQDEILRNDNKILDRRFNLITLATSSLENTPLSVLCARKEEEEQQQQWQLVAGDDDAAARKAVVSAFSLLAGAYQRDARLLAWDLVCVSQ